MLNDWPYGFDSGIKHILVWTRTPIAVDDDRGDVTPESKRIIEDFVERQFVHALAKEAGISNEKARERVMWFKNWVSLQSVRGVGKGKSRVISIIARNICLKRRNRT